jgi:4-amino-4-deoxy-L-arabinose transferase-like glycosyltransferase
MVPAIGCGSHLLIKRRWRDIFRPEWLAGLVVALLTMTPMLVSLYRQYGPYGLEFFFWTQSFGRITGSNYWQDSSGPFFFVHTFLWSFLPWSLLSLGALGVIVRKLFHSRFNQGSLPEYITLSGFLVAFIILSRSSYKLPHYIYVVFPYAAIFTAAQTTLIIEAADKFCRSVLHVIKPLQYFIASTLVVIGVILLLWAFPPENVFVVLALAFFTLAAAYLLWSIRTNGRKWFVASLLGIFVANFMLNLQIYPSLMEYQAGKRVAEYIHSEDIPTGQLFQLNYHSSAFDFYLGATPPEVNVRKVQRLCGFGEKIWVVTNEKGFEELITLRNSFEIVSEFENYRVQILTMKFINPESRSSVLEKIYLLEFN